MRAQYLLIVVLLIGLVVAAEAWMRAQAIPVVPLNTPVTLSGADVGFQIDGHRGDTPVGHVVLRIDGKWVDAQIGGNGTTRIASR